MRKILKKAVPFALALCLLLGLLPFGGLMASAEDTIKGTIPAPSVFGDNYVVTKQDTITIEIGPDMHDNPIFDTSSNASAPADAEAIVFRFSIPNIELYVPENASSSVAFHEGDRWSHVSYWFYEVDGDFYRFTKPLFTTYYFKDGLTNVADYSTRYINFANQLPLNCEGYAVVKLSDIRAEAKCDSTLVRNDVTIADITRMRFSQEWNWYEGLYNKQIYISDLGYVMDVEQFEADFLDSYVPAYEKDTTEPAGDITAKADVIEGTYAELSWTEFEGANRYFVATYTEDGFYGVEKTRKTSFTLEGLSVGTAYKIQILPVDENDKVIGASNVLEITTKEKNTEPYTKGLLEHIDGMTATVEDETVTWEWVDGVDYYAIHLYEADGEELTFVERYETNDKEGTYALADLEEGKEYVVQLVAYGADDSIIFAYEPSDKFAAAKKDTDSTTTGGDNDENNNTTTSSDDKTDATGEEDTTPTGDNNENTTPTGGEDIGDDDQTQTGVATTAGVLAVASLLAGGAAVVTRKRG